MATQICRGFTDAQWQGLEKRLIQNGVVQSDVAAWECAITVFERRMKERFFSCIEALQEADSRADVKKVDAPPNCSTLPNDGDKSVVVPGFAIMALCCLLVETLQSFRESAAPIPQAAGPCTYPTGDCIRPQSSSVALFTKFLQRSSFEHAFDDDSVAKAFVRGIRDGILHEAETRGWVIWREEPAGKIVEKAGDQFILNRTAFYQALKQEFEVYVDDLRNPKNQDLRKRFVGKVRDIASEC